MTPRTFSAPGKLVLCGEYAVVDGRPAVVAAVDRRARATSYAADRDDDDGRDDGRGDSGADGRDDGGAEVLRVRGNDPRWLTITRALLEAPIAELREQPLLVAVLQELRRRGLPLPAGRIEVSTAAFAADGAKLGLGSSAAAAVAFTAAAVGGDLGGERRHLLHEIARTAHRAFQGGGSGIDVAAAVYGGLLRFERGQVAAAPPLPSSIAVVVAWTGIPAKTQGFVDAWRALPDRGSHLEAIHAATEAFLAGCAAGSADDVLRAVHAARDAMAAMGEAAAIDIVTAEHRRIADITAAAGGAAKPSGAGGGDVAVCFVSREERAGLEAALERGGFPVVQLQIGAEGARMDG